MDNKYSCHQIAASKASPQYLQGHMSHLHVYTNTPTSRSRHDLYCPSVSDPLLQPESLHQATAAHGRCGEHRRKHRKYCINNGPTWHGVCRQRILNGDILRCYSSLSRLPWEFTQCSII